jgi:hypothetical protein
LETCAGDVAGLLESIDSIELFGWGVYGIAVSIVFFPWGLLALPVSAAGFAGSYYSFTSGVHNLTC